MIFFLKHWKLIVAVLLIVGAFTGGYKYATGEAAKDKVKAIAELRKEYETKQVKANETNQRQFNELQSVNANLVNDIKRLQHRASRDKAAANNSACKSATGANLSREDATFLTGEAARADKHRTALKACYEYIDNINE